MLAPSARHLVRWVAPDGVHVQHTNVVQQRRRGQGRTARHIQAALQAQVQGHQHHAHAVRQQCGLLLAHHRQLECHGRRQGQSLQRGQQPRLAADGLDHALHQGFLAALARQGSDGVQIDGILGAQMAVNAVLQAVLHQPVVQARVNARPLLHQLDAAVVVDGAVRHHGAALGHVGHGQQVVWAVGRRRIQVDGRVGHHRQETLKTGMAQANQRGAKVSHLIPRARWPRPSRTGRSGCRGHVRPLAPRPAP